MDPMTAMAIMQTVMGGKGVGSAASPFQSGLLNTVNSSDLISPQPDPVDPFSMGYPSGAGLKSIEELLGVTQQPPQLPIGDATTQDDIGGNADILAGDLGGVPDSFRQGSEPSTEEEAPNPFSQFFSRLDNNMQSPSKIIGLGLLDRIDPRLGFAGLLGMGLLGGKK